MLKAIVNSPVRSGDQTIVDGDLIVGTAGEGVNFTANTPLAGMTSQLLNDYEEGTWTPTDTSGAGLTLTNNITATYRKVGKLMFFTLDVTYPSTADTSPTSISLPTAASVMSSAAIGYSTIGAVPYAAIAGSNLNLYLASTFTSMTNANASTKRFVVSGCYPL